MGTRLGTRVLEPTILFSLCLSPVNPFPLNVLMPLSCFIYELSLQDFDFHFKNQLHIDILTKQE